MAKSEKIQEINLPNLHHLSYLILKVCSVETISFTNLINITKKILLKFRMKLEQIFSTIIIININKMLNLNLNNYLKRHIWLLNVVF